MMVARKLYSGALPMGLKVATGLFVVLLNVSVATGGEQWSSVQVRLLPDSSFAKVVRDSYGRKVRYAPHHDSNGRLDIDQLIYFLGTLDEIEFLNSSIRKSVARHLDRHYDRLGDRDDISGPVMAIDINSATLAEMVRLPGIGPVLAVRIYRYRNTHSKFNSVDDLRKVGGIGSGTIQGIRHYIRTD